MIHINASIQELRNITWLLQKNKRLYSDFDNWYSGKQKEMSLNPNLWWVVRSRNKIVKEEDLELYSLANVKLSNRLDYELPTMRLKPTLSNEEISNLFIQFAQNKGIELISNSLLAPLLQIQRIWIDKDYKDYEIIKLINISFTYFKELILEFLKLIGFDVNYSNRIMLDKLDEKQKIFYDVNKWVWLELKSERIDMNNISKERREKAEELLKKVETIETWEKIKDTIYYYYWMAKQIILDWQEHIPMCFFLNKDFFPIDMTGTILESRTQKYIWWHNLVSIAEKNPNIFAVVIISEFWSVPIEKYEEHFNDVNSDTWKGEWISILYIDKNIEIKKISSLIFRNEWSIKIWKEEYKNVWEEEWWWILIPFIKLWKK